MDRWHETRLANIALRVAGLCLLFVAGVTALSLYHRVHAQAPREASLQELGMSALVVGSAFAGNALLVLGPVLWKQVEVPGRRSFTSLDAEASSTARAAFNEDRL